MSNWHIGMTVIHTFHGIGGYTEDRETQITHFDGKKIRTEASGSAMEFNLQGREINPVVPGMYQSIKPKG